MGLTTTSRRSSTRHPPRPLPQIDSKSQRPVSESGDTTPPDASLANAAQLLEDRAIVIAIDRLLEKKIATLASLMEGRARALEEKASRLEERLSRLEARLAAAGIESRARPLAHDGEE
jgi:hypothetical protein